MGMVGHHGGSRGGGGGGRARGRRVPGVLRAVRAGAAGGGAAGEVVDILLQMPRGCGGRWTGTRWRRTTGW